MSSSHMLPMRGSKRGRALAWKRGLGLPVVAPDLALDLLTERVELLRPRTKGRALVVALAAPRGMEAQALEIFFDPREPGPRADRGA